MFGMDELVQVETLKQYHCQVEMLCVEMLFARTQVPCAVVDMVRGIAEQYGTEAAIVVARVVLKAFEAGLVQRLKFTV